MRWQLMGWQLITTCLWCVTWHTSLKTQKLSPLFGEKAEESFVHTGACLLVVVRTCCVVICHSRRCTLSSGSLYLRAVLKREEKVVKYSFTERLVCGFQHFVQATRRLSWKSSQSMCTYWWKSSQFMCTCWWKSSQSMCPCWWKSSVYVYVQVKIISDYVYVLVKIISVYVYVLVKIISLCMYVTGRKTPDYLLYIPTCSSTSDVLL